MKNNMKNNVEPRRRRVVWHEPAHMALLSHPNPLTVCSRRPQKLSGDPSGTHPPAERPEAAARAAAARCLLRGRGASRGRFFEVTPAASSGCAGENGPFARTSINTNTLRRRIQESFCRVLKGEPRGWARLSGRSVKPPERSDTGASAARRARKFKMISGCALPSVPHSPPSCISLRRRGEPLSHDWDAQSAAWTRTERLGCVQEHAREEEKTEAIVDIMWLS